MATSTATQYQYLEPRPGSTYRQLFLKGRRIRAAVVYEAVHGPDPYTPEEFARDYGVPLEAVREALDYVANNLPLIEAERDREAADVQARGSIGPRGREGPDRREYEQPPPGRSAAGGWARRGARHGRRARVGQRCSGAGLGRRSGPPGVDPRPRRLRRSARPRHGRRRSPPGHPGRSLRQRPAAQPDRACDRDGVRKPGVLRRAGRRPDPRPESLALTIGGPRSSLQNELLQSLCSTATRSSSHLQGPRAAR